MIWNLYCIGENFFHWVFLQYKDSWTADIFGYMVFINWCKAFLTRLYVTSQTCLLPKTLKSSFPYQKLNVILSSCICWYFTKCDSTNCLCTYQPHFLLQGMACVSSVCTCIMYIIHECVCVLCMCVWVKGERERERGGGGVGVCVYAYLTMHNSPLSPQVLFSWLVLFILSHQLVHYSEVHIFEHHWYRWIKMQLVCTVIFCAFCCYHWLLFPQCSLVLSQSVSKDAVKLFDDIVVHFTILTLFLYFCQSGLVIFLYIFCAKTMLDYWQVQPNLLEYSPQMAQWVTWPHYWEGPWGRYGA